MQVFNLAEVYNQVDRSKQAELERESTRLDNRKKAYSIDDERVIRESAAASVGPDGEYDPELHEQALAKNGRGDLGRKLRMELAAESAKIVDWINTSLPYVNETNYPKVREIAGQAGIELPEHYNKEQLDAIAQQVLARSTRLSKFGEAQQIPGAQAGTVGQKNLDTGEYKVLDNAISFGRGGYGGGATDTAMIRNAKYLAEVFKIGEDAAFMLMNRSKTDTPDKFYRDLAKTFSSQYDTPEQANQKAAELTQYLYGPGWQDFVPNRTEPQAAPAGEKRPVYDPMGILNRK